MIPQKKKHQVTLFTSKSFCKSPSPLSPKNGGTHCDTNSCRKLKKTSGSWAEYLNSEISVFNEGIFLNKSVKISEEIFTLEVDDIDLTEQQNSLGKFSVLRLMNLGVDLQYLLVKAIVIHRMLVDSKI